MPRSTEQKPKKATRTYQYVGPQGKRIYLPAIGITFNPETLDTDKKVATFLKQHPGVSRLFQKKDS